MKPRDAALFGQRVIFVFAVLFLSSTLAYGATYYVRPDGSNSNNGLSNTPSGAWLTIDWAADHVSAGDVVRVQAGTYAERLTLSVSGTLGAPITLVADGSVTFCGIAASNRNYVRVIGFTMDSDAGGCTRNSHVVQLNGTNTGWEFWHNTFRDANTGIGHSAYSERHHNFIVMANTFTALTPTGFAVAIRGNNNFLAYNEIDGPRPDGFYVDGTKSYWLNNYAHNASDTGGHSDIFQSNASSLGLSFNLFEANFIVGTGNLTDEHGALFQNQSVASCSTGVCGAVTENLFRHNVWHNGSNVAIAVAAPTIAPMTETRVVHDSVIDMMRNSATTGYANLFFGTGITARVHNSLFYRAWGASVVNFVQAFFTTGGATIASADYNLAYTPDATPTYIAPWTFQANRLSNVNPSLTNVGNDDFTIGSGSAARNAGGPLTTVRGTGTGTTFNVETGGGGFFRGPNTSISQYGGSLTAGDVITVGTATRTVARVSGDAVTVTQPLTWTHGDPVYLGTSTTPDIGAYPYKASQHHLTATYAVSNGTATVTPSDASLVRFVVCYQDGIPTTVDNLGPYTCPVGTGLLGVRVYPRYASKTLSVRATAGPPPRPPTNLRIVP